MAENVLSWTPTNWITVLLMGGTGFLAIGLAMKFYQRSQQGS